MALSWHELVSIHYHVIKLRKVHNCTSITFRSGTDSCIEIYNAEQLKLLMIPNLALATLLDTYYEAFSGHYEAL